MEKADHHPACADHSGSSGFLSVFLLAKQKKIFINRWFVDESASTIGADVSAYQAEIDMTKLKDQNIQFLYIKATEGSSGQDEKFAENWENAKMPACCPALITFSLMTAKEKHRPRIEVCSCSNAEWLKNRGRCRMRDCPLCDLENAGAGLAPARAERNKN